MQLIFFEFSRLALLRCKSFFFEFSRLALLRCKSNFQIFELGLIAVHKKYSKFQGWPYCGATHFFSNFRGWPYCGANQTFKFLRLALLRCIKNIQNFRVGLIAVQLIFFDISRLALLQCKPTFKIFELGLIAVHQCRWWHNNSKNGFQFEVGQKLLIEKWFLTWQRQP